MLVPLAGCYMYVPVERTAWDVEQGVPVRALIERQSVELRTYTAHDIVSLEAEFVRLDNSDMVLSALWLDSAVEGVGFPGEGWTIRIPTGSMASLEERKFDKWRSLALVGASVFASWASWQTFGGGGGRGEGGGGGGGQIN